MNIIQMKKPCQKVRNPVEIRKKQKRVKKGRKGRKKKIYKRSLIR